MADTLKSKYGPEVAERIAAMIARVHPPFPTRAFVAQALQGYEALELMARARHIARALAVHLPPDYPEALEVVLRSLGPPIGVAAEDRGAVRDGDGERDGDRGRHRDSSGSASAGTGNPMASFVYLPHVFWIAEHGLEHLGPSVEAMHAITQRFTFEFGIRPFIERHPQAMLEVLAKWTQDPSPQVRRLVSEGTRPRLPWAPRLRVFERDPRPVIALLERLRDDPDESVRRSVANHLNDLGRDDPARLVAVCTRWAKRAPAPRLRLIRHALRTLVKRGDPHALTVLGYGEAARVTLRDATIVPQAAPIGGSVRVAFTIASAAPRVQRLLVDLRVTYAGARDGAGRIRVFKLAAFELAPGGSVALGRRLSLKQMSTRTHHPGSHRVEALVNGAAMTVGGFEVVAATMTATT